MKSTIKIDVIIMMHYDIVYMYIVLALSITIENLQFENVIDLVTQNDSIQDLA